jgi:hypothetical protein
MKKVNLISTVCMLCAIAFMFLHWLGLSFPDYAVRISSLIMLISLFIKVYTTVQMRKTRD